ncbi:MAG TPA: ABC transporter permease [Microscillaceae bacterium]|nr:ABC transporter permease [Microscillaceae bacterium]
MLKNYLKTAFRNLLRNKLFSVLNIMGLVIGMVACLLILQYVQHQNSYDSFHENAEKIYRIANASAKDASKEGTSTFLGTGQALKSEFPEVKAVTTIIHGDNGLVNYQGKRFNEKEFYFVDATFFEVFPSFKLLKGNPKTALNKPYTMVLTQRMADKYFGTKNPIGEVLEYNGKVKYQITGVVENPPGNAHFRFNFLASNHDIRKAITQAKRTWTWPAFYTYIAFKSSDSPQKISAKLGGFLDKHLPEKRQGALKLALKPIQDIYLSEAGPGLSAGGDAQTVNILLIVALFILVMAWVNYINLATARATERAREVGVRKVVGAYRQQLIGQFMGEALLVNLLAIALTLLLIDYLAPFFERFAAISMMNNLWQNAQFWLMAGGILVIGTLLSGFYPAFVLSSYKPVLVLKGKISHSVQGRSLRKGLTLFQFAVSMILIGGTLTVYQQLQFMHNQALGMDIDQILIVQSPRVSNAEKDINVFRQKALSQAQVKSFSTSACLPGWFNGEVEQVKIKGQNGEGITQSQLLVDDQYIPTYGLKLLAGKNFTPGKVEENKQSVVINALSAQRLGYKPETIIDQKIQLRFRGKAKVYKVIGVVNNFHHRSLKQTITPAIFRYRNEGLDYYSIKLGTGNPGSTIAAIKAAYLKLFPNDTFEYHFLDNAYNAQYKADQRFGDIFSLFSGLAMVVACIGLFGLASFTLLQRTKEVGIRKVLGASRKTLLALLLRDFLRPVLLAGVLAIPIMYWGMTEWLKNFAYRMLVDGWLLALPLLMVGLVALLTVVFQTLKVTRNNPIKALRYE